ncbi:MAG: hypothetical protein ACLSA1_08010 [Alphaproteobacteria bacterium]
MAPEISKTEALERRTVFLDFSTRFSRLTFPVCFSSSPAALAESASPSGDLILEIQVSSTFGSGMTDLPLTEHWPAGYRSGFYFYQRPGRFPFLPEPPEEMMRLAAEEA